MFDKKKEGLFKSTRKENREAKIIEMEMGEGNYCTRSEDVRKSIRASFQFIKDNPLIVNGKIACVNITLGVFLTKSIDSTQNGFQYGITDIVGAVKNVCESYVVLTSTNSSGEEFDIKVIYDEIVYFWHSTISENFESYANYINKVVPPLCKDLKSESYNILVRLAKSLGRNIANERSFVFILAKVLTRVIKPLEIDIVRNLIVIDELFINPITSIQGFSQIPNSK